MRSPPHPAIALLRPAGRDRPVRRRAAGLTLMELSASLVITSLIGAAIAAMMFATAQATDTQSDNQAALVSLERGTQRLNVALRGSSKILASGSNYLVLWMGEKQLDQVPSLKEICRIELDTTAHTLTSYRAPDNLAPGSDTVYTLSTDFNAVTTALKGSADFPGTLWADQVTDWTKSFNNAAPTLATLASYQLTVTANGVSATTIGAAALRSK